MRDSRLIQRLKTPANPENPHNPFAFGGGYRNGGLNQEVMTFIKGFCRFDYMGAAEFEWGAVPEGLMKLLPNVAQDKVVIKDKTINILYNPDTSNIAEIRKRIHLWAYEDYNKNLKEQTFLNGSIEEDGNEVFL